MRQPGLEIEYLSYRYIEHPFFNENDFRLADRIGRQASLVAQSVSEIPASFSLESIDAFLISSTVASWHLTHPTLYAPEFKDRVAQGCGRRPLALVNAYECAGWGFVLKHFKQHRKPIRLLLSIMDLDPNNYRHWHRETAWGKSGFGITTMIVSLHPEAAVEVGAGPRASGLATYVRFLKQAGDRLACDWVAPPFFEEKASALLRKQQVDRQLLPNLHSELGHCFGSDPWVGLALAVTQDPALKSASFLASSYALNGYFCAARVHFAESALIKIQLPSTEPKGICRG